MKRNVAFTALFALAFILNGCTAAPASGDASPAASAAPAASVSSVQPQGMYKVQDSPAYTWLKMQDGAYGVWHAGDECNADFSKAPSSCLDTGTYSFNSDLSEVTFVDDATGQSTTSPFAVTTLGLTASSLKVLHTPVQTGTSSSSGNYGDSPSSDDQQPVVTAFNLRKCVQVITMLCNLVIPDPSGMTGPEPLPEPTIELPSKAKAKTEQT